MGESGFKQAGLLSYKNAHLLSEKLAAKGVKTLTKIFFNEFVIEVKNSDEVLSKLKSNKILGGIKLDNNKILVAATEMNTENDIDMYVSIV
jgi:glycine dehydrogenase subunit 1